MRFINNGPSIPDELLIARDEGRVVFFCGAGISRAFANLPDFFGLAEEIIDKLGVEQDGPARRLLQEARSIEKRTNIPSIISADRIFGLLEREFAPHDIEEAVASALKPPENCDLTAHNTLLDLATTPQGTKLVTTNFDRLFDDCQRSLKSWQPPRLPDPLRSNEFNGIVYLHGRAGPNYDRAEGDGFVLSSSAFGRAYLSSGWATAFIRSILEQYLVVFIGYTADDAPVQYLLEALNTNTANRKKAFAFQAGNQKEAAARWRHKGVEAIPYDTPDNSHTALWDSLEAWAERARDPERWYEKVINATQKGPAKLQPHERGQIAHIVSTHTGAEKFCRHEPPPPAEWLCVFDRYRRFAAPGRTNWLDPESPYINPFERYGLDSDPPPPSKHSPQQQPPSGAWDALELNSLDHSTSGNENLTAFRTQNPYYTPRLVSRLEQLGLWLAKVCDQPAAIWWAIRQTFLHQNIRYHILQTLNAPDRQIHNNTRKAWNLLFENWEQPQNFHRDWFTLQTTIQKEGWSSSLIRKFGALLQPYLSIGPSLLGSPVSPNDDIPQNYDRGKVTYPLPHKPIAIPDEWCLPAVRILRRNLELALTLEHEAGGYGLCEISTLFRNNTARYHLNPPTNLSASIQQFAEYFTQLSQINKIAARHEFLSWPMDDDTIFTRLRIWASSKSDIISKSDFTKFIKSLNNDIFWNNYSQRDLLITIKKRWETLSPLSRNKIEKKILKGPEQESWEEQENFTRRRAWRILERLLWLQTSGCELSSSTGEQIQQLRSIVPDWHDDNAQNAITPHGSRSGTVTINTDYNVLMNAPLSDILRKAEQKRNQSDDYLIECEPFIGFIKHHPVRAFTALTKATKKGDFPLWAWEQFLNHEIWRLRDQRPNQGRFFYIIAMRLVSYEDETISKVLLPVTSWLNSTSKALTSKYLSTFDTLISKLIKVLQGNPSLIHTSNASSWIMTSISSPSGLIAASLFNDPRMKNLLPNEGLPPEWLKNINSLLLLHNSFHETILTVLFFHIDWFFSVDPKWTTKNLLPFLKDSNENTRCAAWSGFLHSADTPHQEFFLQIKEDLLQFAENPPPPCRSYTGTVAAMLLAGWGSRNTTYLSDDEMKDLLLKVDEKFRVSILKQAQQWSNEGNESSHKKWRQLLPELIRLWPLQLRIKSPAVSAALCELAFSSGDQIPALFKVILRHLCKVNQNCFIDTTSWKGRDNMISKHSYEIVDILYEILPENPYDWPHGVDDIIKILEEKNNVISKNEKFTTLKRYLNTLT